MWLIDADELVSKIDELREGAGFYRPIYEGFLNAVKNQPAIDAVPVVRCRECKEYRTLQAMTYYKNGVHIRCCPCELMGRLMKDDDFCSYGERKDGDG